jgi:Domain of unknown function (DUF1707)
MPAQTSPAFLHAATRRRSGYGDLRISDAERTEVADLLSKHYGDGRLDQAEFNERLDQAMRARTYKDLDGLFDDLPRLAAADAPAAARKVPGTAVVRADRGPRRLIHHAVMLALIIVIAIAAGHALLWSIVPWVWIVLLGAIVLLATRNPRRAP